MTRTLPKMAAARKCDYSKIAVARGALGFEKYRDLKVTCPVGAFIKRSGASSPELPVT